ncbi:MAG: alkaline phosphatase D family protein [Bacteroidales bacterium]|nr:alkaline phosphatase D family protein [Bacteroidales bacterium]
MKIKMNLSSVLTTVLILLIPYLSAAQMMERERVQYKKQNRDGIADIVDGDPDKAIAHFEQYLDKHPDDLESLYGLAVAYSAKKNLDVAMRYAQKAIEQGLPAERFLAGPRSLLASLVGSNDFSDFIKGRYHLLIHGPMMGNFTDKQACIWVRTSRAADVKVEVADAGNNLMSFTAASTPETDFTAVVTANGLQPATEYSYNVYVDGSLFFKNGHFRTFPAEDKPLALKLGFGGGAGYTPWHERMWDTLVTHQLDAFFLLGDNVYIDHPTKPEVQQYCYYRRQSRPEFRRFTSEVPVYAIWDDHDFTSNDGEGGPEIEHPEWKIPVWKLFKNQWNNPYYGGGEKHPGCWFDFSIGDIDFFFMDCRYYRENPKTSTKPSMLGEYQKQWLKEKLKASGATFKAVASSVPWAKGTKPGSDDTWDGFPEEREEIFSFIEENKIEGVILLSADRHRSDAWKIERLGGYTLYDFMSSRLTNVHTHRLMPGSIFGYNKTCSFGMLEFDTHGEDPKVSYSVYNIENELINRITLYKSQLMFR